MATKRPIMDLEIARRVAEEERRRLLAKKEAGDAAEKTKRKARGLLDIFRRKAAR